MATPCEYHVDTASTPTGTMAKRLGDDHTVHLTPDNRVAAGTAQSRPHSQRIIPDDGHLLVHNPVLTRTYLPSVFLSRNRTARYFGETTCFEHAMDDYTAEGELRILNSGGAHGGMFHCIDAHAQALHVTVANGGDEEEQSSPSREEALP
jgi:hypothetical protein